MHQNDPKSELTGKRILVTGAGGFIGRHLTKALVDAGCVVHTLARTPASGGPLPVEHTAPGGVFSIDSMIEILRRAQPDIVVHLASLFLVSHTKDDIAGLVESNVAFGTRLLEAMDQCGVRSLLNTGTYWQHYEDAPYNPVNLYAATKQAYQDIIEYYVQGREFRVITLELFDTYGPGDTRPKLLALLDRTSRESGRLEMSPGEQKIDLIFIDDVISAYMSALRILTGGLSPCHKKYAVSSGRAETLRDVVRIFEETAGRKLNIVWGGRPYRPREVMRPYSSGEKIPGWEPVVSLEDGIRRTLAPHLHTEEKK